MIKNRIFTAGLLLVIPFVSFSLLPPKYLVSKGEFKVSVKRSIEKTFVAIDKFDHVELGELEGNVVVTEYNDNGEPISIREIDKDGNVIFLYNVEYDKSNVKQSEKKYDKNNRLVTYSNFTYGRNKLVKQEDIFSETGELQSSLVFEYDKAGNLILRKHVSANNVEGISNTFAYDANGLLIEEKIISKDGKQMSSKQYIYENGLLKEDKRLDKDGAVRSVIFYSYDDNGNKIQMTTSPNNGASVTINISYEFDEKGNWTKQIIFRNEVIPTRVITRELSY